LHFEIIKNEYSPIYSPNYFPPKNPTLFPPPSSLTPPHLFHPFLNLSFPKHRHHQELVFFLSFSPLQLSQPLPFLPPIFSPLLLSLIKFLSQITFSFLSIPHSIPLSNDSLSIPSFHLYPIPKSPIYAVTPQNIPLLHVSNSLSILYTPNNYLPFLNPLNHLLFCFLPSPEHPSYTNPPKPFLLPHPIFSSLLSLTTPPLSSVTHHYLPSIAPHLNLPPKKANHPTCLTPFSLIPNLFQQKIN
jgi:hypothetical protein